MNFQHTSVMPTETLAALALKPTGTYIDCTLGGAGHASGIAAQLAPEGRLLGIDQDTDALAAAKERLASFPCQIDLVHDNFRHLAAILAQAGIGAADGILFDLGVSSHQLDTAERGFSYLRDAPLDMRMNQAAKLSAYDLVNNYSEDELDRILHDYGEERWSRRIAKFIVAARKDAPIQTTGALVDIIMRAVPKAVRNKEGAHPAMRTFQAIRIAVNDELGILDEAFSTAVAALKPGGRLAILTFHSLEDRLAKRALKKMASGCICPPHLPVCICHHHPEIKILGKPQKPSPAEITANPRAKSAKLRVAEKLAPYQEN